MGIEEIFLTNYGSLQMAVDTGDKAVTQNAGTDNSVSAPLDFASVTTGSEQLFRRTDTTSTKLPEGMTSSADLLRGIDTSNKGVPVASLDGNVIGRPDKPMSDAQTMLQLTDPDVKKERDQLLNNPASISDALKRVAENPNDPANLKTAKALQIVKLDMRNAGFETTLDLKKGEMTWSKADLDTGEKQTIKFDRNGNDRDPTEFLNQTFELPPDAPKPTAEMNRREGRINASLDLNNINPLVHAVKDLQQTIDRMGDRDSIPLQNRIEQLTNMLDKVGTRLSGDNPFHPVKGELTAEGKFELTLGRTDKLSISPDGTIEINGKSVKPDSKEVRDFLTLSTKLRRLTTNELA